MSDEHEAQMKFRQSITFSLYKKTSIVSILTVVSGKTILVLYQTEIFPAHKKPPCRTGSSGHDRVFSFVV